MYSSGILSEFGKYEIVKDRREAIYRAIDLSEEGDIVLNARIFSEILRKMNGLQVEISADDRLNCNIKSNEATFDIMGMAATDFPEIPTVSEVNSFEIDAKLLTQLKKGTSFAAATSEGSKPILTGIDISLSGGFIQFVAIDGFRMAIKREKINTDKEFEFIVTSKAINEAVKLIEDDSEPVKIMVGERLISFKINGYDFISRLLEGDFVNYQKTLPTSYTQKVTVNTRDLINTIERVSLLINEAFTTPVRCYFNELNVIFTCATSQGRATETFNTKLEGENFEIGLNNHYLLDALKAIEDENINILFNGSNAGVLITPIDNDNFKYMIMPMRLK